ncbi:MotA/TolQ/ExbB proton channel family protein [Salinisphaera sp. T31B1]|uniref:MotA/TolQ/ExbB proton channel family protein n=1 Tax=Salinisphaera sp. T31B1 TaxID=727963 RepID=UPI00333E97A3
MGEMLAAGGWLMLPIGLCSVLGLAIVIERAWTLRAASVVPPSLSEQKSRLAGRATLSTADRQSLEAHSPLGRVWAAVLATRNEPQELRREHIEEAGRAAAQDMARYLNTLGTIAAITPLLGLLGTVAGMIHLFAGMTAAGIGDAQALAGGIGQALVTTAAGLCVAIPALVAYRYFNGCIEQRALMLERQALQLMDAQRQAMAS